MLQKPLYARLRVYEQFYKRQSDSYITSSVGSERVHRLIQLDTEFKNALANTLLPGHSSTVTDMVWDYAWRRARAMGGYYKDVEEVYWEIAQIVDATWQESQEIV